MFYLVIFSCFLFGTNALYSPIIKLNVKYRRNSGSPIAIIPMLLYSGRPATGVSYKEGNQDIDIDKYGVVRWTEDAEQKSDDIFILAGRKGQYTNVELKIIVLDKLENECDPPLQELCFFGDAEYQVFEGHKGNISLGSLGPVKMPCDRPRPKYQITKGGSVAQMINDELIVEPTNIKYQPSTVNVECNIEGKVFKNSYSIKSLSQPDDFPVVMPRDTVRLLDSPTVKKGDEMLVGWARIGEGSRVDLVQSDNTSNFKLAMKMHSMKSDRMSATFILIHLTWSMSSNLTFPVELKVKLEVYEPSARHSISVYVTATLELSDKLLPNIDYPFEVRNVPKTLASYTRITQPEKYKNVPKWVQFHMPLPKGRESPFSVTGTSGIVYLEKWGPQALMEADNYTGVLISWTDNHKRQLGLAWIQIYFQDSDPCDAEDEFRRIWSHCSQASNVIDCENICGSGTHFDSLGKCVWIQKSDNDTNYDTCTPEPFTCPDDLCDPLETLHVDICPQDCTGHKRNGGVVVCSISPEGQWYCSEPTTNFNFTHHETKGKDKKRLAQPKSPLNYTDAAVQAGAFGGCGDDCVMMMIGGGGAIGILLVILGIYVTYRRKIAQEKDTNEDYATEMVLTGDVLNEPTLEMLTTNIDIDYKWEVPRSRITIEECLGEGEFGKVMKATAKDLHTCSGVTTVAVKTLKENAGPSEMADLMSEYELLKDVSHTNVIKLLGACTSSGGPVFIIIEYCELGSLRKSRNVKSNTAIDQVGIEEAIKITPRDILSFAWQTCKGMDYLAGMKLVHRDLAARNILLASGQMCKISDFGLTRDVYKDDTYFRKSRGRVPVKWMAIESLRDQIYTNKSDVWSFGIVLWEMVTLGCSPYPGVVVQNLYSLLIDGFRMHKPNNCSNQLYLIMRQCWHPDPNKRPTFNQLADQFEIMLEDGTDYLNCTASGLVCNPAYFAVPQEEAVVRNIEEYECPLPNESQLVVCADIEVLSEQILKYIDVDNSDSDDENVEQVKQENSQT